MIPTIERDAQSIHGIGSSMRDFEPRQMWRGTFADYFKLFENNTFLAESSPRRLWQAVQHFGLIDQLPVLHATRERLKNHFAASGSGLPVGKRILALIDSESSSAGEDIAEIMSKGLEYFSKTAQGAVFAIAGCPMRENPLRLIPPDSQNFQLRSHVENAYGIKIQGDLCPHCTAVVEERYDGRREDVEIERVLFSTFDRVGIAKFTALDQRLPRHYGEPDETGEELLEDGLLRALKQGNRGLVFFSRGTLLSPPEEWLTLAEEQTVKTSGNSLLHFDETVVVLTSISEFERFKKEKRYEAFHDRIEPIYLEV